MNEWQLNTAENIDNDEYMCTCCEQSQLRAGTLEITPVTHQLPVTHVNYVTSSVSNPVL